MNSKKSRKVYIKPKDPNELKGLGKVVYLERERQCMTEDVLSAKSGIAEATISSLELSKRKTNISTAIMISEAFEKKLVVTYYDKDGAIFMEKVFEDPYRDSKDFMLTLRNKFGLSQGKFAKMLGRTQSSISEIESNIRLISVHKIEQIGEALGCRVEFSFR
jgi:transcriptional regulator with XRE-family HTH domain